MCVCVSGHAKLNLCTFGYHQISSSINGRNTEVVNVDTKVGELKFESSHLLANSSQY